ncbi:hypothetical protein LCGC14_1943610 [marine sediment metagenome]|uniref:Uncharacterized protein n=1 Tax=marine sediment metagenome TaxID=412755 RepID=A0A0F9IGP9_9ZZZZ
MPMSNSQFYGMVEAMMLKCIEVMQTKGKEYTESSDNKLANFEAESLETNVPVLDIIHIFANKHQKAINNFRKTGRVESEALEMRFVDRINYLFLELAECIALGYDPREEWLTEALGSQGQNDTPGSDIDPDEEAMRADLTPAPKPIEDGEPCCGHPGNEQCCEKVPPSPPPAQKKKARRRPARPRIPQDDDNIPIATPDRRLDPTVIAERARAKRRGNE